MATTLPVQDSQPQASRVSLTQSRSGNADRQSDASVSAIFRGNPDTVDLADVALTLTVALSDGDVPSDRDIVTSAENLLPRVFAEDDNFPGLDEISTNFVTGKTLGTSQPDLLDIAALYASTVIPFADDATPDEEREAIAAVVNLLVPGQNVEADDIAVVPPRVPTIQATRDPGETASTALFIGELFSQILSINESVGFSDPSDYYRFELARGTNVFVRLDDPSTDGRLQIGRDLNTNDELDEGELIFDRDNGGVGADELIVTNLDPGEYLIRVLPEGTTTELNYELQVGAVLLDPAFSQEPGNDLANAIALPELDLNPDDRVRVPTVFPGFTSPIVDPADVYQLTVDRVIDLRVLLANVFTNNIGTVQGNIQLIRDLNENGVLDDNENLTAISSGSLTPENNTGLDIAIDPGTYFIQVDSLNLDDITATSYSLDIDGTIPEVNPLESDPGNTPADAAIAPPLDTNPDDEARVPTTFRGFANTFADAEDYYQFELERISNVTIEVDLSDLRNQRALVQIVRDVNQNGMLDENESLFEFGQITFQTSIDVALDPGTYFARVLPDPSFGLGTISYTLSIDAPQPETNALDREPGNTLAEATIVPPLDINPDSAQRVRTVYRGFVNAIADPNDFYRVEFDRVTALSASIADLELDDFADGAIELIQDANGNGTVDDGDVLQTADFNSEGRAESIRSNVDPGVYFIRVFSSEMSADNASASYTLTLEATADENALREDPGDTPGEATVVSELDRVTAEQERIQVAFSGFVGTPADPDDYYSFTLRQPTSLTVRLDDRSSFTFNRELGEFELVQDLNGNGLQEPDEVIVTSNYVRSSDTEQIFARLEAGTYFIRVRQSDDTDSPLQYDLDLNATLNSPPLN